MRKIFFVLILSLFFVAQAHAAQVQFFPPQGPCTKDNPILAWNGSGNTYCTKFPTNALPDCPDGQFLTKKKGQLICSDIAGKTVTVPVVVTTPTQPQPTTVVVTTPAVSYCPAVSVPSCGAGYVLVDNGVDVNGCQISPQCYFVGYDYGYDATPIVYDTYVETGYTEVVTDPYYTEPSYATEPVYEEQPVYTEPSYGDCYYYGDC